MPEGLDGGNTAEVLPGGGGVIEEEKKASAPLDVEGAPKAGDPGVVGPESDPKAPEVPAAPANPPEDKKGAPPAPAAEEEYEIEVAEDSPLTDEEIDWVAEQAQKYGLTKDEAQALVQKKESAYKRGREDFQAAYAAQVLKERDELLKMPEFAPERRQSTLEGIRQLAEKFGGEGGGEKFKAFLKSPAGNNPALAKFLVNLSNAMKSDTIVGKGHVEGHQKEVSVLEKMYPDFYKKDA